MRRSPDGHGEEVGPDGSVASVPSTVDPREPRPPVSHSPPVLSTLANSTQVAETEESLRNLRLSLAGFEINRKKDDHTSDRRAHEKEEAAPKKKPANTTEEEREHRRSSQPAAPPGRRMAVSISAEMAEGLIAILDEMCGKTPKKSDGKKKDDGKKKHDDKKKHDGKDKKHDKRDDDHKPRKDGQTQT
ncbi:hypothetical protein F5Y00DRAFT_233812 [Daldinia vernicosa]|uniref:uncharacterized protein n=1 Tax=Daldinia vernicosa TaxID=114800 RepID=UPI0020088B8E|nr:uncharacterized protein F5Y00DRAFT_233812 [Daldinia vernicosa]KAI0850175.1 hypothetical protein F5Y00DRAFT_233812 [Daldinia vernicosa]